MSLKKALAILQPIIPHFRTEFFTKLQECTDFDLYIYGNIETAKNDSFKISSTPYKKVKGKDLFKGILLYSPLPFLSKKYDILVLMLSFTQITTWLLLLTKFIHRKKIILWGQGISVKRYLKEDKKPDWKLKLMLRLSDGAWIYMPHEADSWRKIFPTKPIVSLDNTISGISDIIHYHSYSPKEELKEKYGINESLVIIYCARFTNPYRRTDLLVNTIKNLQSSKIGFIIIGDGQLKPDFSKFEHVHDFGAVYDSSKKNDLFTIADLYLQPGWIGLSVVEALAYGKPVLTFRRSEETLQCVEYGYILDRQNGRIFDRMDELCSFIKNASKEEIAYLSKGAMQTASTLTMDNMVSNAMKVVNKLRENNCAD